MHIVEIGDAVSGTVRLGEGLPLAWICGPCVIEKQPLMAMTAERLKKLSEKLRVPVIFKSSYSKDNRSDELSYQGPGLDDGLEMLAWIRKEFELPVLSDVHSVEEIAAAREVLDVIQIPAFLCQQTSLLIAAGKSGKPVNVKKGQFMAPASMKHPIGKIVTRSRKYAAHVDGLEAGAGDMVQIEECAPVSKTKAWRVIRVVEKARTI